MDPNPYESPTETQAPAAGRKWHPVARIAALFLIVLTIMLAVGVIHGIYVALVFGPWTEQP